MVGSKVFRKEDSQLEVTEKGIQLAKSDWQYWPCHYHPPFDFTHGHKGVFFRLQSPGDSLNTEKAIRHQKIEGSEVKLQKQTTRSRYS